MACVLKRQKLDALDADRKRLEQDLPGEPRKEAGGTAQESCGRGRGAVAGKEEAEARSRTKAVEKDARD